MKEEKKKDKIKRTDLKKMVGHVVEVKYKGFFPDRIGLATDYHVKSNGTARLIIKDESGSTWGITEKPRAENRNVRILPPEEEIVWKLKNEKKSSDD